jgi:hypothetical protein
MVIERDARSITGGPVQFTRKHSDCNDGTCPAIWDTDDPELVGVQGTLTDARSGLGQVPPHEQVVLIPRHLLESYLKER